jgi:4-hydroxyproline epimerase
MTERIIAIDSHTAGEPTRVIIDSPLELGPGTLSERLETFRKSYDHVRSAAVTEPRGSDALVGALLCRPDSPDAISGVIFFNNVGYLGMCVHGMIGVLATLAYQGRIKPGLHRLDTPVGPIAAQLHQDGAVTVRNVASYRTQRDVRVSVDG